MKNTLSYIRQRMGFTGGVIALLALLSPATGGAADPAAVKSLMAAHQDAVVWVSAVAKVSLTAEGAGSMPNIPDQENKVETLGTIIDPSGLVVIALSQVDPSRRMSGQEFRYGSGNVRLDVVATLKEVKVTMPDGTEIPAELVMKDADLDLAFIQIKTASKEAKGVPIHALDMKKSGTADVGDEVAALARMDETLNRVPAVSVGIITAATKKPREFLRTPVAGLGCPVFRLDGKLIGIAVSRSVKNKSPQTVVLPAADVIEIADQARKGPPAK